MKFSAIAHQCQGRFLLEGIKPVTTGDGGGAEWGRWPTLFT